MWDVMQGRGARMGTLAMVTDIPSHRTRTGQSGCCGRAMRGHLALSGKTIFWQ